MIIMDFQWQSENLGHAYLTHLGWSTGQGTPFLPPFDPKEGQMQNKNYKCRPLKTTRRNSMPLNA